VPDKPLPDVIAPGLDILFCGINPSLMSAARGHHFARPGNRFWPALHLSGLTPQRLTPDEDAQLLRYGLGVTNVVLAVLGITAWRVAFDRPRAVTGLQPERVGGATTWAVPNPSGLNAHAQLPDLARAYAQLRAAPGRPGTPAVSGR
jgi:TDG/mug DNA glycosylase family protein